MGFKLLVFAAFIAAACAGLTLSIDGSSDDDYLSRANEEHIADTQNDANPVVYTRRAAVRPVAPFAVRVARSPARRPSDNIQALVDKAVSVFAPGTPVYAYNAHPGRPLPNPARDKPTYYL